jgi:urate oxidase
MLTRTAYGKSRIRVVRLTRRADRHDLTDLTVAIRFHGDYDASYTDGDNREVLPTDTMKNTVYALAAAHPIESPDAFGLLLARHFLDRNPRLQQVRIDLTEQAWGRITVGGRDHGHAFVKQGPESRTAAVTLDRAKIVLEAGVTDLVILKSADSAFSNFMRDELTTLPDIHDRILATSLTATWRYRDGRTSVGSTWRAVRQTLLESFAGHRSASVQHTLFAMGQAVVDNVDDVDAIHLVMPNKHHLPVDLSRLGLENRNEIFVATDEPFGLIEATVARSA